MRVAVIGGGGMGAAATWGGAQRGGDGGCFEPDSPPPHLCSAHPPARGLPPPCSPRPPVGPPPEGAVPPFPRPPVTTRAGPWTPELVHWIPLQVERQVHVWFELEGGVDWLTPERFPAFILQSREFGDVYGIPSLDGTSMKVGRHHEGEFTDPHGIRRIVDETDIDPLRRMAATYLRGLTGRATRTLTCMYTNTPDRNFVIDSSPGDRRVVVISACSGHGFKFAPVIGDIAADLVCDGATRRDISRFAAARFATSHVPDDHDDRD